MSLICLNVSLSLFPVFSILMGFSHLLSTSADSAVSSSLIIKSCPNTGYDSITYIVHGALRVGLSLQYTGSHIGGQAGKQSEISKYS